LNNFALQGYQYQITTNECESKSYHLNMVDGMESPGGSHGGQ